MRVKMKFDVIIIGAGSAGCVLAYRLSNDPNCRVLLIEAGPPDESRFIHMPLGVGKTLNDPRLMWYLPTEADAGNGNHPGMWVRGKTLGGSSSVNGMIYCRGQPQDYDGWAAQGAAGWEWTQISRCFREMEDHAFGADELRGTGGPLRVDRQSHRSKLTEAIIGAGVASGLESKQDLNRETLDGIGYTVATLRGGRRVSAADAFLEPARKRRNLRIVTDMVADKLLFDGQHAVGVRCRGVDRTQDFRAGREVIVCAGALQSPKLLCLSGIGPSEELGRLGLKVIAASAGVGENLREHKSVTMQHRLRRGLGHNPQLRGPRLVLNALRYGLLRSGPLASTCEVLAFLKSAPHVERSDVEAIFWCLSLDFKARGVALEKEPGLMTSVVLLRPESCGSVRLRSNDPLDPPLIRANTLSAPADRQAIVAGVRRVRDILASAPIAGLIVAETRPGPQAQSDAEILDAARNGDTMAHASGTCRMGSDPQSVVDERLRVRGVTGLRVMDTSVMPTQVSGNTNGPVMAMAWRAAELIREDLAAAQG